MCLLYTLVELAPRWNLRLAVLHADHRLRGTESRADAAFVQELARELGLPFHGTEFALDASGENLEQAARDARLAFFRQFLVDRTLDRVATGHTRSDQAETVLYRFLRGAGTAGLSGIRPVTIEGLVRPLIGVERAEVLGFLNERALAWREDATNASAAFARNRIRRELLPALARDWNPQLPDILAQTAEWAQDEQAYWEAELDRLAAECLVERLPVVLMNCERTARLPRAAARRVIRRAVERAKGDLRSIDFGHVRSILEMAGSGEGHGRMQVPGLDVFRSFEWIRLAPPGIDSLENRNFRLYPAIPGTCRLPDGGELSLELVEKPGTLVAGDCGYNGSVAYLDWERVSGTPEVRNWRPGDQYCPAGHSGEEKLKGLFQRERVPLWERRNWPILVAGEKILWARRFGAAAAFAVGSTTRKVLAIRESRG